MSNFLASVCIICTLFSATPSTGEPDASSFYGSRAAVVVSAKVVEENARKEAAQIDYLAEIKRLGYYKDDSKDQALNNRNAIIRFQSSHNLNVDGTWNEKCMKVLKRRIEDSLFVYPDKVASPPTKGKWIIINKSKLILTLYESDCPIKKYPVAVGNPPSRTPEGKFSIVCKIVNPAWGGGGYAKPVAGGTPYNPLGYRWMGLSEGGGSSYGIHGNNRPYSIGTYASHGCIRMINSDVEELFDRISNSTIVWIGSQEQLSKWGVSQNEFQTKE